MGVGWGQRSAPHPLFVGKTPRELEEMSIIDLSAHSTRAKAYAEKIEEELLVHRMVDDHERGRRTLLDFPRLATGGYRRAWEIARRRANVE